MLKYTGYVTRPTVATREEARAALNLDPDARIIVVSFGGGLGTEMLWEATIAALAKIRHRFLLRILWQGRTWKRLPMSVCASKCPGIQPGNGAACSILYKHG
ncbi:MAG: hypothetical protein NVS3B14_08860 [Ktedonobacteraceae bacterium]